MVSKDLFPYQPQTLDINGLSYRYIDEGSGDPVVMVHGNPTWSFYYRNLIGELSRNYRTIAPDHIGCGQSDKPGDDQYEYTLESRVDDLERLLDHLGIRERITLILHDWGGMIGMAYASRHPQRIQRIAVMNTAAFPLPQSKSFPFLLWLCRTPIGAFLVRRFNAFSALASVICCKRHPMPKAIRRAYREPYNSWRNRIATLRFVQDIPLSPKDRSYQTVIRVEQSLGDFLNIPLLICWGEKDFVFSVHFLEEWIRRFPKAEVHRFPDGGHYILEDAKEEVIPLISRFLKAHPI